MKQTEYQFTADELERKLPELNSAGITELAVYDPVYSQDKGRLLRFLHAVEKYAPGVFIDLTVDAAVLDSDVCHEVAQLYCACNIPLHCVSKDEQTCLFDKKIYAGKARMMNSLGLVFGFDMDYAIVAGDSLRSFRDRLDFAVEQYPNHIDFPQIESESIVPAARPTAFFSLQDIRYARDLSFACRTFYSAGRAVPWFLSVLRPLRIQPSRFFADFAEWQRGSSCSFGTGFNPDETSHEEIEKMQLLFLSAKYEEKEQKTLFPVVKDIVRLNGAFSRLDGEGNECTIETEYNPDDLLSPESTDIKSFQENVCMEHCSVKIFYGEDAPDYKII